MRTRHDGASREVYHYYAKYSRNSSSSMSRRSTGKKQLTAQQQPAVVTSRRRWRREAAVYRASFHIGQQGYAGAGRRVISRFLAHHLMRQHATAQSKHGKSRFMMMPALKPKVVAVPIWRCAAMKPRHFSQCCRSRYHGRPTYRVVTAAMPL